MAFIPTGGRWEYDIVSGPPVCRLLSWFDSNTSVTEFILWRSSPWVARVSMQRFWQFRRLTGPGYLSKYLYLFLYGLHNPRPSCWVMAKTVAVRWWKRYRWRQVRELSDWHIRPGRPEAVQWRGQVPAIVRWSQRLQLPECCQGTVL